MEQQSDIARFRERQALQEQSAIFGLFGPAAVASHEAIVARMERRATVLLHLFSNGQDKEALRLWEDGWLVGEEKKRP